MTPEHREIFCDPMSYLVLAMAAMPIVGVVMFVVSGGNSWWLWLLAFIAVFL